MSNASRMHVQINIILNKFKHFFFSFTFIFIIKKTVLCRVPMLVSIKNLVEACKHVNDDNYALT